MHAGIVGAGIIGRLLAYELLQQGWRVSLFDRQPVATNKSCSMTAAGLLTPITELDTTESLICTLGSQSLQEHWPRIIAHLGEVYFRQTGSLVTAFTRDRSELQRFIKTIVAKNSQANLFYTLDAKQITELEPDLTQIETAYYFPTEGQIDNQTLLSKLAEYLQSNNIVWHADTQIDHVSAHEIKFANNTQRFDMVLDCRGLGGKQYYPELRGVRGELIWLQAPEVNLQHPIRVLHPRYKIYVVPRPQNIYLIGATEIESEDDSEISVRSTLELLSTVYNLHAGFREARVIKTSANCRPTLPNHLPCIKYQSGLIAVNGLYRHGFLLAPLLCHEIARSLAGNTRHHPELWQEFYD